MDSPYLNQHNYILVFKEGVSDFQVMDHLAKTGEVSTAGNFITRKYNIGSHFRAFAARLDDAALAAQRQSPLLKYIEADSIVHALSYPSCETTPTINPTGLWGLSRISQRKLNPSNAYLRAPPSYGQGVDVYVIDTGILYNHTQFEDRVIGGRNFVNSGTEPIDDNGHGTHCSGTIAGKDYGIARKANLFAVKVLNRSGSGTITGVVDGINWAATNYQTRRRPSVANMSLGGGVSTALNDAVDAAVRAGVTFIVAAGNENTDACRRSPASAPLAFTVGATDNADRRASFSNYGKCVDIFAPGVSILSAWNTSPTATNTISGTSMATPHVVGVAALYLGFDSSATTDAVKKHLVEVASDLENSMGPDSPQKMLYIDCPGINVIA